MADRKPEAAPRYDGEAVGPWVARERCAKCGKDRRDPRHGPRPGRQGCYYRRELRWQRLVLVTDD